MRRRPAVPQVRVPRAGAAVTGAVLVGVVALGATGCTGGDGAAGAAASSASSSAALTPSGLNAIAWGFPDPARIVTDGTGALWWSGPDSITRLTPASGRVATWDVSDDVAFAATRGIAPAAGGGVWLLSPSALRLFDGRRFTRVVDIPAEYRADPEFPVVGLVEQGDAVWVTNDHDVTARWQGGTWTRLPEAHGGPLAVDSTGALWAGGRSYPGPSYDVASWDGTAWTRPGEGSSPLPGSSGTVVALASDGRGGMWLAESGQTESGPAPAWLWHGDGRAWSRIDVPPALGGVGGDASLAVAADGVAWLAGASGVARYATSTGWTVVGTAAGLPSGTGDPYLRGVAVAGGDVYALTPAGLDRLGTGRTTRVWRPDSPGPTGVYAVVAVSADEVWAAAMPATSTSPRWWRWRDASWRAVPLPTRSPAEGAPGGGALASDGAVWLDTDAGLVRVSEGRTALLSRAASTYVTPVAGPDGSVYTVEGRGRVVRVHPDGRLANLGAPSAGASSAGDDVRTLAAAPDGSVWAASSGFGSQQLWRWQGSWQEVDVPDGVTQVTDLVVARDGRLWVAGISQGGGRLARRDPVGWTILATGTVWRLAAGPDGTVCASDAATCYPGSVPAAAPVLGSSRSSLPDSWAADIDIAPDGAVWVVGETVLRVTR